jgi:hypothetical protein
LNGLQKVFAQIALCEDSAICMPITINISIGLGKGVLEQLEHAKIYRFFKASM